MNPHVPALRWVAVASFALLALGYGLYQRWMWAAVYGGDGRFGFWDLLLEVGQDPQFRAYVIVPAWLLIVILRIRVTVRYPRLIRLGGNFPALWAFLRSLTVTFALGAVACVIALGGGALGLPLGSSATTGTAAGSLHAIGITPLLGFVFQLGLGGISLLVMGIVLLAIRLASGSAMLTWGAAVLLWLWNVLSSAGLIDRQWASNATYYFNPGAIFERPLEGVIALVVLTVCLAWASMALRDLDRRARGRGLQWQSAWAVYGVISAVVLLLSMASAVQPRSDLLEAVGMTLYGGGGTITQFLAAVVLYLGFAFVIQVQLSEQRRRWTLLGLIRFGSPWRWAVRLLAKAFLQGLIAVIAIGVLCMVAFILVGGRSFAVPSQGLPIWLYHFFVNGTLQLAFYVALSFLSTLLVPGRIAGLASLGLLVVVGALWPGPFAISPIGVSAMIRVNVGWDAVLAGSATLALALGLTWLSIWIVGRTTQPGKWT